MTKILNRFGEVKEFVVCLWGQTNTETMKGKIFINSIGERHKIVRVSKGGNKVTAENLSDNEEYIFYFEVPKMKFIKSYTSDVELGIPE